MSVAALEVLQPSTPIECAYYSCKLEARHCVQRQQHRGVFRGGTSAGKTFSKQYVPGHLRYCASGECAQGRAIAEQLADVEIAAPRPPMPRRKHVVPLHLVAAAAPEIPPPAPPPRPADPPRPPITADSFTRTASDDVVEKLEATASPARLSAVRPPPQTRRRRRRRAPDPFLAFCVELGAIAGRIAGEHITRELARALLTVKEAIGG